MLRLRNCQTSPPYVNVLMIQVALASPWMGQRANCGERMGLTRAFLLAHAALLRGKVEHEQRLTIVGFSGIHTASRGCYERSSHARRAQHRHGYRVFDPAKTVSHMGDFAFTSFL